MNGCGKIQNMEVWEEGKISSLNKSILLVHMVGKYWESVREEELMLCRLFTKTGCGITASHDDGYLIQLQWFHGEHKIGSGEVIEVQQLPLSASQSAEITPDGDEVNEGFGDVIID